VQVRFTASAIADLANIRVYIGKFNPAAAGMLAARLITAGRSLADFPDQGRPIGRGRREWPVVAPYVIRYRISGETIFILRIRHGRQRPLA
jgi:plasmid stabilization system protein ParE